MNASYSTLAGPDGVGCLRLSALIGLGLHVLFAHVPHKGQWAKRSVDNVHTFRFGLVRTAAGLARIPQVYAGSQQRQGQESRSSPTSATAYPLVRGGFCF